MIHSHLQPEPYEVLRALLATGNFNTKLTTKDKPSQVLKDAQSFLYKLKSQYKSWEDMANALPKKVGKYDNLNVFLHHEIMNSKHDIPCTTDDAYAAWKQLYTGNIKNWQIINHSKKMWSEWEDFACIVNAWRLEKDFATIGASEKIVNWFLDDMQRTYNVKLVYTQEDVTYAKTHARIMEWQRKQFNYSKPVDLSDFDAVKIWHEQERER